MNAPLSYTVVDIVGSPFVAIWRPEDGSVCAAGFLAAPSDLESSRLTVPDAPAATAGPGGNNGSTAISRAQVMSDPLWDRLTASDPGLAGRGLAAMPATSGAVPDALRAYTNGDLTAIDSIAVAQQETPFRGEVWRALRRVPAGDAVTYTTLAALTGRPAAVRAAASGCATNLVALIVPCHRIVRADGGLGGYLFGTAVKHRLLTHEGALG